MKKHFENFADLHPEGEKIKKQKERWEEWEIQNKVRRMQADYDPDLDGYGYEDNENNLEDHLEELWHDYKELKKQIKSIRRELIRLREAVDNEYSDLYKDRTTYGKRSWIEKLKYKKRRQARKTKRQ